jgi:D-amino-acid dehydrogenase
LSKTVAVIGAGIVGVQIARRLQIEGLTVSLYDKKDVGTGASFGNAGYIATDEILPLAHKNVLRTVPAMLFHPLGPISVQWSQVRPLLPWFRKYLKACTGVQAEIGIRSLASIQNVAKAAWQKVVVSERLSGFMREKGALKIFESDKGYSRTRFERKMQTEHGIRWESRSRTDVLSMVPELTDGIRSGIFYPDGMNTVSPYELTWSLFEKFLLSGGRFIRSEVKFIKREGLLGVVSDDQTRKYDHVVLCAGYLSATLLSGLGFNVPLVAERGYHVELECDSLSFDMPIGSYERGCYFTPMLSGLRVAGTSEITSPIHPPSPRWKRAEVLYNHFSQLFPKVESEQTSRWMGHRPTLPDFLPAIGKVEEVPGLLVAFGHHHLGLTLSAITAQLVKELISDEVATVDVSRFSINRFTK